MSSFEHAVFICAKAYDGKVNANGTPTFLHPLRLMMSMQTNDERIVAVVHDLCYHCPDWTVERLAGEGFSAEVMAGIDAVTPRENEPRDRFIARVATNDLARRVKLMELISMRDTLPHPPQTDADRERLDICNREIPLLEAAAP